MRPLTVPVSDWLPLLFPPRPAPPRSTPAQLLVQRITSCKSSISQQVSILKGLSGEDQSAFVAPVQAISSELSSLLGLVQQFKASGNTFDVADAALGGDFSSLVQGLLGQLTDVFQLLNSLGAAVQLGPLLDSLLKEVLGLVGQLREWPTRQAKVLGIGSRKTNTSFLCHATPRTHQSPPSTASSPASSPFSAPS